MDPLTVLAFCPTGEFARIERVIREWPGVETVGSLRIKERKKDITNIFIKFNSEDIARSASLQIDEVPGLYLTDEEKGEKQKGTKRNATKGRSKAVAIELMNFGTYDQEKDALEQQRKKVFERNRQDRESRGRRTQRGFRGFIDNRGTKLRPFIVPSAQVNVAFVDNIPFNMTNDQLIEVFSPFGRVLDINRYELMAMIFYDSPESVLRCIQQLNGKTVRGNIISVSSGSVRIPGPVALQMGI
ncbi:RNA-binding protein [Trypanosoma cruzi]|nr:RNA-binding protein [Trypanosoma cruzi]